MSTLAEGASITKLWMTQRDIDTLRRGLSHSAGYDRDSNIEPLIARLAAAEARLREAQSREVEAE